MLFVFGLFAFLINIPFGLWRRREKRMSVKWFIAIHAAVPLIALFRYLTDLGHGYETYLIVLPTYALGQYFFDIILYVRRCVKKSGTE